MTNHLVNNPGQLVSDILGSTISDVDNTSLAHSATNGKLQGIAIYDFTVGTGGPSGAALGSWEYKLASGGGWVSISSITSGSALLLDSGDSLRFVPNGVGGTTANNLAKPTISYYAWDQAVGTAGTELVIASNRGLTTSTLSDVSGTVAIAITDVNDMPVITAPATASLDEDQTKSITVSIADVDVTGRTDGVTSNDNLTVNLSVSHGTITLSSTTGLTFNSSTTNGSASLNITGSLSAINTALTNLTYAPSANFNGVDALVVDANDLGNVGGAALSALQQTVAITVNPINDAPVLTGTAPAARMASTSRWTTSSTLVPPCGSIFRAGSSPWSRATARLACSCWRAGNAPPLLP